MLISPVGTCSNRREVQQGFTLFEIILVIFIISLFAGLVLPSFSRTSGGGPKTQAKKTASLLRYLNDSAIYSKQTWQLTFDFRNRVLSWTGPDGNKSEPMADIVSADMPSHGTVREGELIVLFTPLGLQENLDVVLGEDSQKVIVSMNSLSGRVKVTAVE